MQIIETPSSSNTQMWCKDDNDACSESASLAASPDSLESKMQNNKNMATTASSANAIDVHSHVNVCIQFFETMIVGGSSPNVPPIPAAVGHIYKGKLLNLLHCMILLIIHECHW